MRRFPAVLLVGIAVMVLTIVLYFTILGNALLEAIHFIALVAILLSEGITTAYACVVKGSPRKFAAVLVSGVMIPFAIVLSMVYIVNFPKGYGTYLGWYFAGHLVTNILAFILLRFDAGKKEGNQNLQNAKSNMLGLRKLVKCILADPAAQPFAARLNALEEKLHFSNDGVIEAGDENIRLLLLQLQENIADPEFDTEQMLTKLEKAVDVRSIMTSRNV